MSTRLLHSATLAVAALAANAFAADATVSATTTTAATTNDAARIAALEKAVSDLMQEKGENWLTAQRASEIRAVVQDVLSDADTRANLQGSAATAGYDDGFFIASPDGNFKLKVNGDLQNRFAYSWLSSRDMANSSIDLAGTGIPGSASSYSTEGVAKAAWGFEVRRAKLEFSGHVADPSWQYAVTLAYQQYFGSNEFPVSGANGANSTTGSLSAGGGVSGGDNYAGGFTLENAYVAHDLGAGFSVQVGQFKSPFLREWLVSSKYQLAAERSITNTMFNTGWTQGLQLNWKNDQFRTMLSYNDGANNANLGATSGTSGFSTGNEGAGFASWAFTGRGEWMAFGNWKQFSDFSSMRGEGAGLLLGAAVNWQSGGQWATSTVAGVPNEPQSGNADAEFLTWTVDATWELGGASLYGAWMMNTAYANVSGQPSINSFGSVVQGGYFISDTVELFGRWEWMNTQSTDFNEAGQNVQFTSAYNAFVNNIGSIGMNWYIKGRSIKFTTDAGVSWSALIFQQGLFGDNIAGANYRTEGGTGANPNTPFSTPNDGGGGQIVIRSQLQLLF